LSELLDILDEFKELHGHTTVPGHVVELNECFRSSGGWLKAPKAFGDLNEKVVLCYVVRGSAFIQKYMKDDDGKLLYEGGKYVIRPPDREWQAVTCLCCYYVRNTSYLEIHDVVTDKKRDVQGWRPWHIRNIDVHLKRLYDGFDAHNDAAFIFAGRRGEIYPRLRLNMLWYEGMAQKGGKCFRQMVQEEAGLMELVFPKAVLDGNEDAILRGSYMYGRENHTPASAEFLSRKVHGYQKYVKHTGGPALRERTPVHHSW
jgi:hypothetical protein